MVTIWSVFLALLGTAMLSAGSVFQKKGSIWMKWGGRKKNREWFKYLLIWIGGFYLFNFAIFPNGAASKDLPPHIMAGVSGIGITIIIILSYYFLKEKLLMSDIVYSLFIVVAIVAMSVFQQSEKQVQIHKINLYILMVLPIIFVLPVYFKQSNARMKTILFAALSGNSGGLALVLMNVTVKESGSSIAHYVQSPFLYLWIGIGIVAQVSVNLAYKNGEMVVIAPVQNSLAIIYPVICSYFVFNVSIHIVQIAAILVIVYSSIAILRNRQRIDLKLEN